MINFSPSADRIGRACVCILEEQMILMVSYDDFFTFPGGGVNLGESFEDAATREAFEEAGATVKIIKFLFEDSEDQCKCYLAKLEKLEASPEGRVVRWVNALEFPWCEDKQIKPALQALKLRGAGASESDGAVYTRGRLECLKIFLQVYAASCILAPV